MQEKSQQNITPKKEKSSFTKSFIEQLELIVIFFAVIVLVFSFMCNSCMVDGDSMINTLHNEERIIIWSMFYEPDYEDIVVIHDSENLNKPIVKRVIGLEGDTIHVEHYSDIMKVTVTHADGSSEVLEEDYINYDISEGGLLYYPHEKTYTVGEGQVFVMGDNRLNSIDSRLEGCYDSRQILGKVIFRITPFDKMGTVN
ncbi:MAG: signal peptidase I [Ruminococcaceae bacterium]|nr:signal peptidase I [Oscillospiraceae bacterium]